VALACLVVLALLLTYRPLGPLLTGPAMVAVAVLAGVQLVLAVLWPPLSYRRLRWRLDAAGLHLRRGVLWRSDITVPRSRVQHTDVSQGPFARLFGLASLVVYTAGTEHSEVALPGLRHATACAIRDFLIAAGADEDR
jgi:membrane protein YdbS with pleckstrin-like domain